MYWKMNRLGFINFWKFKKEEFYFSDGCSLIRGHNGSGKSIVVQSAVTFLFDGSTRKLDPSGTNARDMSFYVLGDNKKEATSYVYLEFINNGKYSTIGVGLKGKRNKGIDFWGFGLSDGRRIGDDISLYENGLPLTKAKMKSVIGTDPSNFFVTKQGEYESEVNKRFFGLEPARYKELLHLLSEIRKPIAGADRKSGLSFIYDKLNNSLPVLPDDDFESLASSLEMMDSYSENLEILKNQFSSVQDLKKSYDSYNNAFILKKHALYLKAQKGLEQKKNILARKQNELNDILSKRKAAENELVSAEIDFEKYDALGFSSGAADSYAKKEYLENSLKEMKKKYDDLKTEYDDCQYECDELKYDISKIEDKISSLDADYTPSLSGDLSRCLDLLNKIHSLPDTSVSFEEMKDDINAFIDKYPAFGLHDKKKDIFNIVDDNDMNPSLRYRSIYKYILEAYLEVNNKYVERNAYLKAKNTFDDNDYYDELMKNNELISSLRKDLEDFPLLNQLFLVNMAEPGKRESLLKEFRPLYLKLFNDSSMDLSDRKSIYEKVKSEYEKVKECESLNAKLKNLSSTYDKQLGLLEYYRSVCDEYKDSMTRSEMELKSLSTSYDEEEINDFMTLREKIISSKATISNFDEFVIPDKKTAIINAEKECNDAEKELSLYEDYSDLSKFNVPEMSEEDISNSEYYLVELYMRIKDKLSVFHPDLIREGDIYKLKFSVKGTTVTPEELSQNLYSEMKEKEKFLSAEENEIYQKILIDYLYEKIKHQIEESEKWVSRIRNLMKQLKTTSGKVFSIKWIPVRNVDDFSAYFKEQLEIFRNDPELNYMECIKECLDYRHWFEFRLDMNGVPLSNKRFLTLSGGERATAIYSTLLSALNSMYNECPVEEHPRLFALDEAFTVVDNKNIESVFQFVGSVGLDYLMNSQTLWGTYPSVKALSISHLTNFEDKNNVIVTRFRWNGAERLPQFSI